MTGLPIIRTTSFAIGIIAVSIVLGTVYLDMQDTSPGEISRVHAQHAELAGSQNCVACHGQNGQSMNEACQSCHEDIELQLAQRIGFHGNIANDLATDCAKCHSEHHGEEFPITNERSFALAGVDAPHLFKHTGFGFHLTGKHLRVSCQECHPNANVKLLATGQRRFLGLSQECTSCHQDVHDGTYGQDCASCHGQRHAFSRVAQFEHTQACALVGAHGKAACAACHQADSPQSVATLISARSATGTASAKVRTCVECHLSPHNEHFLDAVSRELNVAGDTSCQHCHSAVHETFVGPQATLDTHLHARTGFPLDAPHDQLACSECHAGFGQQKPELGGFRMSYPGRQPDQCHVCHVDPHQGQFELGSFRGADCLTCHHRHTFLPSAFTHVDHNRTRFPLVGAHSHVACNQCHHLDDAGQPSQPVADQRFASSERIKVQPLGRPELSGLAELKSAPLRIFHGTPTSCKACHDDPHRGQFEHGPFRGSDCSECHDERSFQHSTFSVEQHAGASFPLTGAHLAVACKSCHKRPNEASVAGRASQVYAQPATVRGLATGLPVEVNDVELQPERQPHRDLIEPRIFHGTQAECSSCHADVHDGRFDLPHLPEAVSGNTGCARCHTTETFQEMRSETFDHASWTGYALRGGHARARCLDCHRRSHMADSRGRTLGCTVDRNCQSCHRDPHVGQFGPTATVRCTQCHVEGDSFRELVFDHQRHSQFPLDRDHVTLACSACHKPQPLRDGRTAIRYKPLGTQCGDCHVPRGSRRAEVRNPR
jgi:hypothetical protein